MSIFEYEHPSVISFSRDVLLLLLIITFSPTTTAQQQASSAQLTIEGVSNSLSTGSRSYIVTKYADESCSKLGKTHKVFKKKYAKNSHTFKPLDVDVNQPFLFQVSYIEERRTEIKRCASIANVDLKENGNYKAIFSIVDEVIACNIKIYDLGATANIGEEIIVANSLMEVEFKKPDETCSRVGKKGYGNGVPVYTYKNS